MTRKKVKLAWIASDSARRASLRKRRQGLLKKVHELSTLCDVGACVIIYSPDDPQPLIWPTHALTYNLLARFQSIPEAERGKKMLNQENYVKERLDKTKENLKKIYRINKEMEMTHLMSQIHNGFKAIEELNGNEIRGLMWLLEEKCREVRKRCDYFSNNQMIVAAPGVGGQEEFPPPAPMTDQVVGSGARESEINLNITHSGAGDPSIWDPGYSNLMNNNNVAGTSALGSVQMTQVKQEFDLMPPQFNNNGYFVNCPSNYPGFDKKSSFFHVSDYKVQGAENNMFIGHPGNQLTEAPVMTYGQNYYGGAPMIVYGDASNFGAMTYNGGASNFGAMTYNGGASNFGAMSYNGGAFTSYQLPPTGSNNNLPPTGPNNNLPPTGPNNNLPPTGSNNNLPPTGPNNNLGI